MKTITGIGLAAAVLLIGWVLPSEAQAFTTLTPTAGHTGHAHTIYVGSISHGGTAGDWVCFDDLNETGGAGDHWLQIGSTSSLNDDYEIHGGSAGDTMVVIRLDGTTVSGNECAGTWDALDYGAHFLDLVGDGDVDYLYSGIGDTYTYGMAGADRLYDHSNSAAGGAYGGSGNDKVFGMAGTVDRLSGEGDADCLYDQNSSWDIYDCGSGSDTHDSENSPPAEASCGSGVDSCGF